MESQTLAASAQRVQDHLRKAGLDFRVVEMPASTRSAAEAAAAIGCEVAQIAKSLIFRGKESGKGILVIASGINRVDERKVAAAVGEPLGKADADFVRETTGYAIGGVPPCGHANPLTTLLDPDLWNYDSLWAAAGTPNAVFRLEPDALLRLTEGRIIDLKKA